MTEQEIRHDERVKVIAVFRTLMSGDEWRHRHVDDAVDEILDAVADLFEQHDGLVRG